MLKTFVVKELQGGCNILCDLSSFFFSEVSFLQYMLKKRASIHLFENQVKIILILEPLKTTYIYIYIYVTVAYFNKLHNVWLTTAHIKDVNLT